MSNAARTESINILFDNPHFTVAEKPAGWLSTPPRFKDSRAILGRLLEERLRARLWPVHRLDVEVSGLVLFAKSAEAHRLASECFEKGLVGKTYEALTEGEIAREELGKVFEWSSRLLRGKKRTYESPHGKPSLTEARCEKNGCKTHAMLWHLQPRTGRSHQLRYELSHHGFPILGDALYGANRAYKKDAIALRAVRLDFSKCPKLLTLGLPMEIHIGGLE